MTIAMTMAVAVGVVGGDCGLAKAAPRAATENGLPDSTQILPLGFSPNSVEGSNVPEEAA